MEFLSQHMQTIITSAVILLCLLVAIGAWRAFSPRVSGGRRGQRLGVSEYYEVDKDRRLVLVRRDAVEHLILIGGPQDIEGAQRYVAKIADRCGNNVQAGCQRWFTPAFPPGSLAPGGLPIARL